ncbi:hypothetical protein DFH09DRAFT_1304401 [Mycena vulgaris]|nr:hypothetical protein DFH09DRAFT_1304401 [Mycena vulgaris]
MPNWINATYNGVTRRIPEFRPGAAFWRNAALIRVTSSAMDVGYVNSNNSSSPWISGSSFALPFPNQVWVKIPTNNGNYFGPLKSIYVDTRAFSCSPFPTMPPRGSRENPDPKLIIKGSRQRIPASDPLNGEPAVAAVDALV